MMTMAIMMHGNKMLYDADIMDRDITLMIAIASSIILILHTPILENVVGGNSRLTYEDDTTEKVTIHQSSSLQRDSVDVSVVSNKVKCFFHWNPIIFGCIIFINHPVIYYFFCDNVFWNRYISYHISYHIFNFFALLITIMDTIKRQW